MNRRLTSVLSAMAVAGAIPVLATTTAAEAVPEPDQPAHAQATEHNRADALATKRTSLRQRAVDALVNGEAQLKGSGENRTIQMKQGGKTYEVDYPVTQTAQLLTFLVDFGDENTSTAFPDVVGPRHNEIPEPGADDNSTYWEPDFSPQHYRDMFFGEDGESFKDAYDEMSSGRFDLEGDVSDWIQLDKSAAMYSQANGEESNVDMTNFVQDTADKWYAAQKAAGKTDAEIEQYLERFDIWDRYDLDGDGNFNEADGYIDHFQAVHAGEGEEAGAEPWTIWSHRWAVNPNGYVDGEGPEGFPAAGGIQIGDSNIWIRDYTTEPENGGLGVFAHEFGHDLGLPDFYDTNGSAPDENGTGFWTLMSSGSWLGHGDGAIGTTPNHMGPAEKLFLGWYGPNNQDLAVVGLDQTVQAGTPGKGKKGKQNNKKGEVDLGPSYHATTVGKQAALVQLPPGEAFTATGTAASGEGYLYGGRGDEREATATSSPFTVPDGGQLTAKVAYSIERDWDYAYVEVSTDGGSTFAPVETNLSTTTDPNQQNRGFGITGSSDPECAADASSPDCLAPNDDWVDLTADLSSYAGQEAQLRLTSWHDAAYSEFGIKFDDVAVGSALTDDFESGFDGWTLSTGANEMYGITGGGYTTEYEHYYLAENRQYKGYDTTLAQGPYNFGWLTSKPNTVEHYPYQDGLLVWYVNGLYGDNNTSQHPGYGQSLPVDANPDPLMWPNGDVARGRIQSYDATFDVDRTDAVTLHREAETLDIPSRRGVTVFDDSDVDNYWNPENPYHSTKVAGTGTTISVLDSKEKSGAMTIKVRR